MRITWSDRAVADLAEIRDFIAQDSPTNAVAFVERLLTAVETLEIFPDQGRRVPEAPELPELRELIVDGHRVIYRRQGEQVEIVMVIDGRRDLSGMEPKPW